MKPEEELSLLEDLAARLGYTIRQETRYTGRGSSCRLREDKMIIIPRKLQTRNKVEILIAELSRANLEGFFIPPKIRDLLESSRNRPLLINAPGESSDDGSGA